MQGDTTIEAREVPYSGSPLAGRPDRGRPPKAVIFDFDDTLVDSFDSRLYALEKVFRLAGIETPTAHEFMTGLSGRQLFGALDTLAPGRNIEGTSLSEAYRDFYWTREPGLISLFPGIRPLLRDLHSSGCRLGVFTQKSREFEIDGRRCGASRELDELGVASLFSVVVGFEDVARHKPDPEGVELALDRLGVLPEHALLVGDTAADIEAARAAGCPSCHATWGIQGDATPLGTSPDYVAGSPAELRSLVL